MSQQERLVAVISPWEKLPEVVKKKFRVESLPREKKAAVWREDLQAEEALKGALKEIGIRQLAIRIESVTTKWQDVD